MYSSAEIRHIGASFGDVAVSGTSEVPGRFTQPQGEIRLAEGTAPAFHAAAVAFSDAGVSKGSTFDTVRTYDGRTLGPFKVISWETVDDGVFVNVGLQQL